MKADWFECQYCFGWNTYPKDRDRVIWVCRDCGSESSIYDDLMGPHDLDTGLPPDEGDTEA